MRRKDDFGTAVAVGVTSALLLGVGGGVAATAIAPKDAAAVSSSTIDRVIVTAEGELGTSESPAGSNRTKYGRDYGLDGEPWCAEFVWWVFDRAGAGAALPKKTAGVYDLRDAFKTEGRLHSDPRPGDVVLYSYGKGHTGIVVAVQDTTITAIEGNTSATAAGDQSNGGVVARKTRARDASIIGYGRPDYSKVPTGIAFGALSSKYDDLFVKEGAEHGVSPVLLAAVAKTESSFNPSADNGIARGLMQITQATAVDLGGIDPMQPDQAVDGAARLLSQHTQEFGSTELALSAYNAGPANVRKCRCVLPATQAYVNTVLSNVRSAAA